MDLKMEPSREEAVLKAAGIAGGHSIRSWVVGISCHFLMWKKATREACSVVVRGAECKSGNGGNGVHGVYWKIKYRGDKGTGIISGVLGLRGAV